MTTASHPLAEDGDVLRSGGTGMTLEAALEYAGKGYYVHPVTVSLRPVENGADGEPQKPKKKALFHTMWGDEATIDEATIRSWWGPAGRFPKAGIAICCHRSGIAVVDLDGQQGLDNWALLTMENGDVPTAWQETRSGGKHYVYRQRPDAVIYNTAGKIGLGIDVRGAKDESAKTGGTIFTAPTQIVGHPEQVYEWKVDLPPVSDLSLTPEWLPPLAAKKSKEKKERTARPERHVPAPRNGDSPAEATPAGLLRYLEEKAAEISALPVGGPGTQPCNDAAFELSHYVAAGQLTEQQVRDALRGAVDTWQNGRSSGYDGIEQGLARIADRQPRVWGNKAKAEIYPAPDDPMSVARRVTRSSMVTDDRYTLRRYTGGWMRWDGPCWTEVTDDAVKAVLYPVLEKVEYWQKTKHGFEPRKWAPNRRKVADLVEALAAVTYLPEATSIPAVLEGIGHGPGNEGPGPGMDRAASEASPQVDRGGPGGPGSFQNSVPHEEKGQDSVPTESAQTKQWGSHPVRPVHGSLGALSPAKTLDRALSPLPRSTPAAAILACTNGLLDIRTRTLYALTPRFFNRVSVPFAYDPHAAEPAEWHNFLTNVWGDDTASIEMLREWIGYVLSGATNQQKIMAMIGPPRSGKGTIGRVVTELIGPANVASTSPTDLPTAFGLASLVGKSLAIMADARTPGQGNEMLVERLLTISGEDSVVVQRKYRDDLVCKLPTRFLLMSNDLPGFRDPSGAIASRLVILRMTRSNLGSEDHGLLDRLLGELPGILKWALEGLDNLNKRGKFAEPESAKAARQTLAATVSPIKEFLGDCCVLDTEQRVTVADIYKEWQNWCEGSGHKAGSDAHFGKLLFSAAPGITPTRPRVNGVKVRMYAGVRLRTPADDAAEEAAEKKAELEKQAPSLPEQQVAYPTECTECSTRMGITGPGITTHPNCDPRP